MKKWLSGLLAAAIIVTSVPLGQVKASEATNPEAQNVSSEVQTIAAESTSSEIKDIRVDDLSIIEYTNGYYTTEYNPKTGRYDLEWYRYNYYPTITVTLKDGSVKTGSGSININGTSYSLSYSDGQSYDNQWGVGKHIVTARIMGKETTFTVEIVKSPPIESISVENVSIIEYTNGYYTGAYNSGTGKYDLGWYRYNYSPTITVTLKDGSVKTGSGYNLIINGTNYFPSYKDDQSDENQWGVGKHIVTARIMGKEITFTVEIVENPIASISVEDVSVIEYTNGNYYTEGYNSETGKYEYDLEWYRYNYSPSITATLKDGSVKTGSGSVYINGTNYSPSYIDDQSYNNQWGIGEHTVTVRLGGKETTFTVEIRESPYVELTVLKMLPVIENQNCTVNEAGNVIYDIPVFSYKLTAKDGSYVTGLYDTDRQFFVMSEVPIKVIDTQSKKPWTIGGNNSFIIKYGDLEVTVPVEMQEASDFEYVEQNDGLYITDCGIMSETIEIPETINGKTVVGIISLGTAIYSAKSIVIPDTVKSIGKQAFISDNWLYPSVVETISIGSGVTYLDADMFGECSKLKSVTISKDNPYYCDIDGVVYDKAIETLIYYPVGKGNEYTVPATVTNINVLNADIYRDLNITFAEGSTAFVTVDGVTYTADMSKVVFCNPSKTGSYVMPDTVTEIVEGAFKNSNLTTVKVSNKVTEIVYEAFANCSSLTNIELPANLKSIGDFAFWWNSSLTTVTIPDGVVEIGNFAFHYSALEEVTFPNSVVKIGNQAFYGSSLTEVTIPDSVVEIGDSAFDGSPIRKLDLGQGVQLIGASAFERAEIEYLTIPESVTYIGKGAFSICKNLKKVELEGRDISIGESVFYGCPLEDVNLENVRGKIGKWAFGAGNLTSLSLPEGVTEVAYAAFAGNTELVTIDVPESLVRISGQAFDGTAWEKEQKDGPIYLEHIFYGYKGVMSANTDLVIKNGTTVLADFALMQCDKLSSVSLPEGLKTVGAAAFWGDFNIKEIQIPASVSFIGKAAFAGCDSLEAINVDPANKYFSSVDGVLFNKDKTELIWCPKRVDSTYEVPSTVTLIKEGAFGESGLENIKIRNENVILEKFSISYKYDTALFYGDEPWKYRYSYVTLQCIEGSAAHKYAEENLLGVELLVPIEGVALDQAKVNLKQGESTTLTATINPNDTTDDKVLSWTSSDERVVRIVKTTANNAEIETVGLGTATITVTTVNGKTASCEISVEGWVQDSDGWKYRKADGTYPANCWEEIDGDRYYFDESGYRVTGWQEIDGSWYYFDESGKMTKTEDEREVVSISVRTMPNKISYCVGEVADYTGLIIKVTYEGGPDKELTEGFELRGFDSGVAGISTVTVNYEGVETSFAVNIQPHSYDNADEFICSKCGHERKVLSISVQAMPNKISYCVGEKVDYAGLIIKVTYDDGPDKELTEGFDVSGFDSGVAGVCSITVKYKGAETNFGINISEHDYGTKWMSDSESHWQECSVCGNKTELIRHIYDNACDTTCNVCGETRNTTHNFGEWKRVKEPSVAEEGLEKRTCIICGHEETRTVERLKTGTWKQDSIGWWYQNPDGTYPTNCWKEIDGAWYYFNASGYMVTGWQVLGGAWYYFDGSGAMVTGWQALGGTWYYFSESGAMVTGWQAIGGTWYYFDGSGAMVTGWQALGGTWYYFDGSGAMVTGWQALGGTWYYFSKSGVMMTGWQLDGETWYYFNGSGAMVTGWLAIGGTWYYLNGSGAMLTGWQVIGGAWYYFGESGVMAANQWVGNYYLQADGSMATNKWIGGYYVGADGLWRP